jgi:hypothetical protein
MKKNRLIVEYEYDFDLFGLLSSAKEYKVAWILNQLLRIRLVKENDIILHFNGEKTLSVSNFLFETEHTQFRLLKNKSISTTDGNLIYLLPEVKDFDFLILVQDPAGTYQNLNLSTAFTGIPEIQYCQKFDVQKLKSKENLLF